MKITNTTHWRTDHLRAILQLAADLELEPFQRRKLTVRVIYSRRPGRVSGCARLGNPRAPWMELPVTLRIPKAAVDPRAFAWLACHEFAHSRGMNHRTMPGYYRWGGKDHPRYAFAEGRPIERPQAKPKPGWEDVRLAKLLHAQTMLKAADTRLKRAKARLASAIAAADARIAELTEKRAEAEAITTHAQLDAAARAEARVADIAEAKAQTDARRLEAEQVVQNRANQQATECDDLLRQVAADITHLTGRLASARADLAAAEAGNVQAQQIQADLDVLRRVWDETTAAVATLAAQRQEDERTRQALEGRRADLAFVGQQIGELQAELLEWALLAKALGRDGLPVLEIDAAGPTVSSYTNDLLASCFGPRFSVELVTQEAKVSGKGLKESFDIKVYDNERGGDARDIADLSGGEQVIVEEALKNAIALFVNGRNASPIRTCWRDETTGPLDPENAARYLPMLRRVQQLGGFRQVLFISHNPDAAAMADAQLRFADGRVTVVLPPYGSVPDAA